MAKLINAYTVSPNDIEPGDEMCFVVKAIVTRRGADGKLYYRLYRCPWAGTLDNVPQGSRMGQEDVVCQEVFHSLWCIGAPD